CGIFATLSPAGEMLHLDKPAIIRFGRFQDQVARQVLERETADIEKLFAGANFASKRIEPAEQILWEKWLMLATMAGSTCLMRGSVGAILDAEDGQALMQELLAETISVASAAGFQPSEGH